MHALTDSRSCVFPENIKYYVECEGRRAMLSRQIIYPRILQICEFLSMCKIDWYKCRYDKKLWREKVRVYLRERRR
jgi:hypothetical protein